MARKKLLYSEIEALLSAAEDEGNGEEVSDEEPTPIVPELADQPLAAEDEGNGEEVSDEEPTPIVPELADQPLAAEDEGNGEEVPDDEPMLIVTLAEDIVIEYLENEEEMAVGPAGSEEDSDCTSSEGTLSRWRSRNTASWQSRSNKRKRNLGQAYVSQNVNRPAKAPQIINCQQCTFKCSEKISEERRSTICSEYWTLEDYNRKKDFILNCVKLTEPVRRRPRILQAGPAKQRKRSLSYFFKDADNDVRVCKMFFFKTLNISYGPVNSAIEGKGECGTFILEDKRGKKAPGNKTPEAVTALVKEHIKSFPTVESHYSRSQTKRQYLDCKLSIAKMYELYVEKSEADGETPVAIGSYRTVFGSCFNLSFFKPKKDQCVLCARVVSLSPEERGQDHEYNEHISRRNAANALKEEHKQLAKTDETFETATFDLQSVLQVPSSDLSPMYYARKICVYNLTVYEGTPPNQGYCYTWSELNGKRGSNEIGTALHKWLSQLPENVSRVSMFSDTCSGQNRNQNVAALLMLVVQTTNIKKIEHCFLESGHSHMECDSMHSAIENRKKWVSVYTIQDWINIFRAARSNRARKNAPPYNVTELKFDDFYNLEALSKSFFKNKTRDVNNKKVNWLKVKGFMYEETKPWILQYSYGFDGVYTDINVMGNFRGRPKVPQLTKKYKSTLPISKAKKDDLLRLCTSGAIPVEFHGWFRSLKTSAEVREVATEPAEDDPDEEEDSYEEDEG